MPEKHCSTCKAAVSEEAKFCPECGSPLKATPPNKPATKKRQKKKPVKNRSRVSQMLFRYLEILGQAIVNALDWFLIVALMPLISVWTSHVIGTIAAWLAGAIAIACTAMIFRPMPVPMGNTKTKAKAATVMMLIGAVGAYYYGQQADELADLKEHNVSAYLTKLREYKGDEKWLAAVRELTPENYAETSRQYDAAQAKEALVKAEKKAAEERRKAEEAAARQKEEAISRLKSRSKENPALGVSLGEYAFGERWSLKPSGGILRCELGPVANGAPRPLVLLDADKKTYALNGAALGTGKYEDGRSLAIDGDIQVIRDLIPIGIAMCDELSKSQCGTAAWAYNYAEQAVLQRLKSPADASVSMLHASTTMKSCGIWLVKSYVDATNGFGAKVRTHFTAEMTRTSDGQWTANVLFAE